MKILLPSLLICSLAIYVSNVSHNHNEPPASDTLAKYHSAVAEIESNGEGFAGGKVKQRFEKHIFTRLSAKMSTWRARQYATSYGKYQILAANYKQCGFEKVEDFIKAQKSSEKAQDSAFIRFIQTTDLDSLLYGRNYKAFARRYNGKGYKRNRYDKKLKEKIESQDAKFAKFEG